MLVHLIDTALTSLPRHSSTERKNIPLVMAAFSRLRLALQLYSILDSTGRDWIHLTQKKQQEQSSNCNVCKRR